MKYFSCFFFFFLYLAVCIYLYESTKKKDSEGCSAEMNTSQHLPHYQIEIALYSKYPLLFLFLPNTDHF